MRCCSAVRDLPIRFVCEREHVRRERVVAFESIRRKISAAGRRDPCTPAAAATHASHTALSRNATARESCCSMHVNGYQLMYSRTPSSPSPSLARSVTSRPPRPVTAPAGRAAGSDSGAVSCAIVAWYVRTGYAGMTDCVSFDLVAGRTADLARSNFPFELRDADRRCHAPHQVACPSRRNLDTLRLQRRRMLEREARLRLDRQRRDRSCCGG